MLEVSSRYLKSRYPNYNQKSVSEEMGRMRSLPVEEQLRIMQEYIHLAKFANAPVQPPSRSPLSKGAGTPVGVPKPVVHKSDEEAMAAALKDIGVK